MPRSPGAHRRGGLSGAKGLEEDYAVERMIRLVTFLARHDLVSKFTKEDETLMR